MRAKDILADDTDQADFNGVSVRKGTIGAFLINAKTWSNPETDNTSRAQAEMHILEAVPALRAIGLFDVLSIKDAALATLLADA